MLVPAVPDFIESGPTTTFSCGCCDDITTLALTGLMTALLRRRPPSSVRRETFESAVIPSSRLDDDGTGCLYLCDEL